MILSFPAPISRWGLIALLGSAPGVEAGQAADIFAYAQEPHSGKIRYMSAADLRRTVTARPEQTWRIQNAPAGPTFEVSFADIDQGAGIGFDHPEVGPTRVATALAVFDYLSSLFPNHHGTARIHFERSNADLGFPYGGVAFPYVPGYPCAGGFQHPLVFDAIVYDRHVGDFDGSIILNFGPGLDVGWNDDFNREPGEFEQDLYSLILHEMGHVLGFTFFAYDENGVVRPCQGQPAFPLIAQAIRNEAGDPLWILSDGIPVFAGDPQVDLLPSSFASVDLPGSTASETRLDKTQFNFDGKLVPGFTGHWHSTVGTLMGPNQPSLGIQVLSFSETTLRMLNDVVGYANASRPVYSGITGSWFDPSGDGRGFSIQYIDENRFLVYFYGFLDSGERLWLIGVHEGAIRYGSALQISMLESEGGTFNHFDPDSVDVTPWGELTITFADCDTAEAALAGPEGEQVFNLVKLAGVEGLSCVSQ